MVAQFDVPGSARLRDVSRPAPGETPAQRLHRLAAKAQIEGVRVFAVAGHDRLFAVSSARIDSTAYLVEPRFGRCGCDGWKRHKVCTHLAAVLNELGELPDAGQETTCPDCLGEGYRRMHTGDRPTDWWSGDCRRCCNTGAVPAA